MRLTGAAIFLGCRVGIGIACGELRVVTESSAISAKKLVLSGSYDNRATYKNEDGSSQLYHTSSRDGDVARWVMATSFETSIWAPGEVPPTTVLAFAEGSWAASPLLIEANETAGWRWARPDGDVNGSALTLECLRTPLTLHIESSFVPDLSGFYVPTGEIADGAQRFQRVGGFRENQFATFGPVWLTYHHTPPKPPRWMIVDTLISEVESLAYHEEEVQTFYLPDEKRLEHLLEERLKEWKGE